MGANVARNCAAKNDRELLDEPRKVTGIARMREPQRLTPSCEFPRISGNDDEFG